MLKKDKKCFNHLAISLKRESGIRTHECVPYAQKGLTDLSILFYRGSGYPLVKETSIHHEETSMHCGKTICPPYRNSLTYLFYHIYF